VKIHHVVVEIHRPTETYPGQVAEGRYTFEDGEVIMSANQSVIATARPTPKN
jgi:hypothetical protein